MWEGKVGGGVGEVVVGMGGNLAKRMVGRIDWVNAVEEYSGLVASVRLFFLGFELNGAGLF